MTPRAETPRAEAFFAFDAEPGLAALKGDARPAFVYDRSGRRLLWLNPAAAAFLGAADYAAPLSAEHSAEAPLARQIARLSLAGAGRLERLRFFRGLKPVTLTCRAMRLRAAGESAVLLAVVDGPAAALSAADLAARHAAFAAALRATLAATEAAIAVDDAGGDAPREESPETAPAADVTGEADVMGEAIAVKDAVPAGEAAPADVTSGFGSETEADATAETGTEIETGSEAEAESETGGGAGAEAEQDGEAGTDAEAESVEGPAEDVDGVFRRPELASAETADPEPAAWADGLGDADETVYPAGNNTADAEPIGDDETAAAEIGSIVAHQAVAGSGDVSAEDRQLHIDGDAKDQQLEAGGDAAAESVASFSPAIAGEAPAAENEADAVAPEAEVPSDAADDAVFAGALTPSSAETGEPNATEFTAATVVVGAEVTGEDVTQEPGAADESVEGEPEAATGVEPDATGVEPETTAEIEPDATGEAVEIQPTAIDETVEMAPAAIGETVETDSAATGEAVKIEPSATGETVATEPGAGDEAVVDEPGFIDESTSAVAPEADFQPVEIDVAAEAAPPSDEAPAPGASPEADGRGETAAHRVEPASDAADAATETEASAPKFVPALHGRPIRFVFELDEATRFGFVSPDLAAAVGPRAAAVAGERWSEVASRLGLDPERRIAGALERRDTFTGLEVAWPVDDNPVAVPVGLTGMPVFGRDRSFRGYRGFGVCRVDAPLPLVVPAAAAAAVAVALASPVDVAARDDRTFEAAAFEGLERDAPEFVASIPDALVLDEPVPEIAGPVVAAPESTGEPAAEVIETEESPLAHEPPPAGVAEEETAPFPDTTAGGATDDLPTADADTSVAGDETVPDPAVDAHATMAGEETLPAAIEAVGPAPVDAPVVEAPATSTDGPTTSAADPASSAEVAPGVPAYFLGSMPLVPPAAGAGQDVADGEVQAGAVPDGVTVATAPTDAAVSVGTVDDVTGEGETAPELPLFVARDERGDEDAASADEAARADATNATDPAASADVDEAAGTDPVEVVSGSDEPNAAGMETGAPVAEPAPPPLAPQAEPVRASAEIIPSPVVPRLVRPEVLPPGSGRELSRPEREAFRQIAEALGARYEEPTGFSAPAPEPAPRPAAARVAAPVAVDAAVLDRLPVALVILKDGDAVAMNRAFLDLVGHGDAEAFAAAGGVAQAFAGRALRENESVAAIRRADGIERPVAATLHAIQHAGGPASLIVLRETTETTAPERASSAEARLSELEAILDTATDGVVVVDAAATVIGCNRSAEALFGAEKAEIVGRRFVELLAPESHRAALDYLDGLARNGVASVLNDGREVIGAVRQGGYIPLFMTMGRVGTDKFCAVLRDITHWKRVEEELTTAKRQAETASSQKSEFLARISHEIRTPLNAIIGFSEVMMEERFGPVGSERYKEYLRDINMSGTHIMSLVNDLLDLSKIEAGKLDLSFEAVSVNDVLRDCVALMQPQANRERIIIRTSLSSQLPSVVADQRSLRQIVLNLLSNAVKFTPQGGQVIVSSIYEDNGEVALRVRDTGVGMSPADIQKALEPFRQLHTTRAGRGTGLGLPLTKALVEANRANFRIDSGVGQGTLVQVTFPSTRVLAE